MSRASGRGRLLLHACRPALAGLLLALPGCAYVPAVRAWDDGAIAIQARFPRARTLAGVPAGTRQIELRVVGEGVPDDAVLAATLTPERTHALFASVPAGPKRITAKAYDGDAQVLAVGQADVAIVAGATVAARLQLLQTADTGQFELVLE